MIKLLAISVLSLVAYAGDSLPDLPEPDYGNPQALKHLGWIDGSLQSDYEPDRNVAAEKLKKAEEPNLKDVDDYLDYLALLDASGNSEEAAKKIHGFLAKYPNDKRAVFLLSVNAMRTKKRELALFILKNLENDAKFPFKSYVYNNLGMIALQDRNRREAIDYFQKAAKATPDNPAPLVNLGSIYLQSRSYKDAHPLFDRAHDIDDEFEDAALGLGVALEGRGKFEEAYKVYDSFASDHPDALSVVYNNAVILGNRLNKKQEAAEAMLRYIQRGGKETAKAQKTLQGWR